LVNFPFHEEQMENNVFLRVFLPDVENEDLKWHIDLEDRIIKALEPNDWKFQFDNQLPVTINGEIFVPSGVWHRLIKGSCTLKLQITKLG
jgi:hypothetical protein